MRVKDKIEGNTMGSKGRGKRNNIPPAKTSAPKPHPHSLAKGWGGGVGSLVCLYLFACSISLQVWKGNDCRASHGLQFALVLFGLRIYLCVNFMIH